MTGTHGGCLTSAVAAWPTRARAMLPSVLAGLRTSTLPNLAWRFSRLTADRFPLEVALASGDPDVVRYTVEVAGPEMLERDRLAAVVRAGEGVAGPADDEVVRGLAALQDGAALRWGAWLGVRHTVDADGWKVYAEVPRGADSSSWHRGRRPAGPSCLRMIGYDVTADAVETYHRLPPEPDVRAELTAAGHGRHVADVTDLLRELAGDRVRSRVPPATYGLSIRRARHRDEPEVLTLYAAARSLIGPEPRIRERLGRVTASGPYAVPGHRALAGAEHAGRHGMVGVTLVPGRSPRLVVGISAPHHDPATPACGDT